MKMGLMTAGVVAAAIGATTLAPQAAHAQCYGCGGFVGGLAGGIIGGAIAGSIAANAQPRPVYVIQQQRRVVQVRRAAPRPAVARVPARTTGDRKAVINASADPFATSKPSAGSIEPMPVAAKQ